MDLTETDGETNSRFGLPRWDAIAAAIGLGVGMFVATLIETAAGTAGLQEMVVIGAVGLITASLAVSLTRRHIGASLVLITFSALYAVGTVAVPGL